MKFEFIANACGIFTNKSGSKLLCDPWINDGVFEGSWCHFHPLKTTKEDFEDIDCLYISHLHPDHFDARFFDFPLDTPIITLDHGPSFLIKILKSKGYKNVIGVKDGDSVEICGFKLSLFAPFAKHNFHDAKIGNLIDSAIIVGADDVIALNANDNTPTPDTCRLLRERFGRLDLAMINYNAAGPYPSCFDNLSSVEKKSESDRIVYRNFNYMLELINILNPKFTLPFAGAYVIGGKLAYKNDYLGTTTWDHCKEFLDKNKAQTNVICLRENDVFDLNDGKANNPYIPIDVEKMKNYIHNSLEKKLYPYELLEMPSRKVLEIDIATASKKMFERCQKFGLDPKMKILIKLSGELLKIYEPNNSIGTLTCELDERLLRLILDRTAHWNNAEIGCHISFVREPNTYDPDLHTALQFFHL